MKPNSDAFGSAVPPVSQSASRTKTPKDKSGLDAADYRLLRQLTASLEMGTQTARPTAALPSTATAMEAEPSLADSLPDAFHAVARALLEALHAGHACLDLKPESLVQALLGSTSPTENADLDAQAKSRAQIFLSAWKRGRLHPCVGLPDSAAPLVLVGDKLYTRRDYRREADLARQWVRLGSRPPPEPQRAWNDILRRQLETHPLRGPSGQSLVFDASQQRALRALAEHRVLCLTGGPGTGKTTLAAALLRLGVEGFGWNPERMHLCAPTGRAAQRLGESLQAAWSGLGEKTPVEKELALREAVTWQRLLGADRWTRSYAHHAGNPLDADVVLLDEASMVPSEGFLALLESLPTGCHFLLLGDPDQLPAVESGDVLGHLVDFVPPEGCQPPLLRTALSQSHRGRGALAQLAETIRRGEPPSESLLPRRTWSTDPRAESASPHLASLPPSLATSASNPTAFATTGKRPGGDAPMVLQAFDPPSTSPRTAVLDFALDWMEAQISSEYLEAQRRLAEAANPASALASAAAFATPSHLSSGSPPSAENESLAAALETLFQAHEKARLLTLARRGPFGCEAINAFLETRWRFPGASETSPPLPVLPIILRARSLQADLPNGAQGLLWRRGKQAWAWFRQPAAANGFLRLPLSHLPAFDTAFALTTHQSQGSEFDAVGLILPEAGHALLSREALYTASTRAKQSLWIWGAPEAWSQALSRTQRRQSGLGDRLREILSDSIPASVAARR